MTSAAGEEDKARRSRVAPLVALAIAAALFAMIVVRYKQAVAERASYADTNAAAAAAEASAAAGGKSAVGGGKPVARTTHGAITSWQPDVSITGTLTPIRESNINFKIGGRLASVKVKVGDTVKAGDVLATLDASDVAAQLKAASAQVHSAEVALYIAADEEKRSEGLTAQGAISAAQLRADRSRAAVARAGLEAAQAQTATVSAMLDSTRLVAPFAGLVTLAPSAPGAVINPNMPGEAFMRIEDTSSLRFTGTLSIEDALLVHVGTPIEIEGPSGQVARGTITAILPSVDSQTRRVPVLAELKNDPAAPLLAGIFARGTLRAGKALDVIKLPGEALRPGSQNEVVVLANGRAQVKSVLFTRADDGSLLVRSGVTASDDVVLSPPASIKTGDELTAAAAVAAN